MDVTGTYAVGDWLVHSRYGMGQIKRIEKKPINRIKVKCYRVKTKDCTYWLPIGQDENPRVRSVASLRRIQRALKSFDSMPDDLEPDGKYWSERIKAVREDGSLTEISKLVRDLAVVQLHHRLPATARKALEHYRDLFLREWSMGMDIDIEQARRKLDIRVDALVERAGS